MRQWTVDSFTPTLFGGNPACVVEPLPKWPADGLMQSIAQENNAGATAFLVGAPGGRSFGLRWFTPSVEVPLCGHATLAAAHVLFTEFRSTSSRVNFETRSGSLSVGQIEGGYELSLPLQHARRIPAPPGLAGALGVEPLEVWTGAYLVALLATADEVRALSPDLEALRDISLSLGGQGNVGVAALDAPGSSHQVVDRFFAPGYGIPEDPATGSFHGLLTPIVAPRLATPSVRFAQAYPGRGAELSGWVRGDRVMLSGKAVTYSESCLRLPVEG
ncbi:PhzF family phenazine biosynthesis protein [Brevundimonas sp.]|uniref:PhzF family phenazine biosynthesis protein n=1 Tax=Brevundimonas sp. TaxID=1871086 RepID=UPI002D53EF18|nr:PhzF family phenazine biosynthesis protein [Brevundimonas sp.]HYD27246.1 PhzF family phenazine biosynthesis protein [Brevundimonas sp.]